MEQEVNKPKRTKLRKINSGLKSTVKCSGQTHTICLTSKGHLVLAHHSDEDLNTDIVLGQLGSEGACHCADVMKAWRLGEVSGLPRPMDGFRCRTMEYRQSNRWIRRLMKRARYEHRHIKPLHWPVDTKTAIEYIDRELERNGLKLKSDMRTCWSKEKDTRGYRVAHTASCNFPGFVATGNCDIEIFVKDQNLYLDIPQLNWHRITTKQNLPVIIQALAFNSASSWLYFTYMSLVNELKSVKYAENQEICKKYYQRMVKEKGVSILGGENDLEITFSIPGKAHGSIPYVLKSIRELTYTIKEYADIKERVGDTPSLGYIYFDDL